MKNNSAKRIAFKALIQNRLYSLPDYDELKQIIEFNQFTVINYKKHSNSEYVSELIKRLRIEDEIFHNDSFIYWQENLRFVFLNEDISADDKRALLCHELGHILDPDIRNFSANYSKIKKEEFANEFSCYVKSPSILCRLCVFIIKNFKLLLSTILLITFFSMLLMLKTSSPYESVNSVTRGISTTTNSDNMYYVTKSGQRYHRKFCIIVKTRKSLTEYTLHEAISAGYTPCLICFPEE